MKHISNEWKGMLAAFSGNAIFGLSFLFSKMAMRTATPLVLLSNRFLLSFALLNLLLLTGRVRVDLRGKSLGKLFLLGLFQPIAYFLCENYGLRLSASTFAAVMISLIPIASLIFAAFFLRERPTVLQCVCSVVSVSGVVLLSLLGSSEGTFSPAGCLLLIGAIVSAVGFNALSRKLAASVSAYERTYMMFLLGCVCFTAMALRENRADLIGAFFGPWRDPSFGVSLIYLAGFSSVGAFMMLNYAMNYLTLARAASFANVTTIVSILAGVFLLHEAFGWRHLVGTAMIIAGLYGVNWSAREISAGSPE